MNVEEVDEVEFDVEEVDVDGLQQKVSATNFVKYKGKITQIGQKILRGLLTSPYKPFYA